MDSKYVYCASAKYLNNYGDTTGYFQIARSFINSFDIANTDDYWIKSLEKSTNEINVYTVKKHDGKQHDGTNYCIGFGPSQQGGFYRGPFYRDDGAMFLAYDYLAHPDTLHFKDILLLNKDWYSYTPTAEGQIYFVPADKVPTERYNIQFGYILLQDSVKECYEFYHQSLEVTPKNESVNTEP